MQTRLDILHALREFIHEKRAQRLHQVASNRTDLIKVVIEDIYQDRNAGAVFRTCDCFGIQNVAVINNEYNTKVARDISKGAEKWLHIEHFGKPDTNNTITCIDQLKQDGFQVVATTPYNATVELPDFEITGKTAFLFGTELNGLTDEALQMADTRLRIPIYGFTESFNISVSAALVLQSAVAKMRKSNLNWWLSEDQRMELEIEWILTSMGEKREKILEKLNTQES